MRTPHFMMSMTSAAGTRARHVPTCSFRWADSGPVKSGHLGEGWAMQKGPCATATQRNQPGMDATPRRQAMRKARSCQP